VSHSSAVALRESRTGPPWLALLLLAVAGLMLRIAAARGGLWLDEAWSAAFAHDVATPIGVFTRIHHDNNHHLNTIWLQVVGWGAPALLQRALSIAAGTATIVVAGLIAGKRGRMAAIIAAGLVAISPIMVTYGSEARGYAPMLLVLALAVLAVDRWLDDPAAAAPTLGLIIAAVIGMLAQLTMVFGLAAIAAWIAARRWRDSGLRTAAIDATKVMAAPLLIAAITALAIVRWLPGPGGFHVGSYQPFRIADLAVGQGDLIAYTLGTSISHSAGVFAAVIAFALLAWLRLRLRNGRGWLYALAIGGLPAAIAIGGVGNAAIARYYLVGGAALLLLVAEVTGPALVVGGWRRVGAIVVLGVLATGSLARDAGMIRNRRADPAAAIALLQRAAPRGTTVTLDRIRAAPVLEIAAAQARYPLTLSACGDYLFVDRDGSQPFPKRPVRCGRSYRMMGGASVVGLSGTAWRLYRRG